jgi:antitoxin HigA-1
MDKLPNIHPGEVLREEFLVPMGVSQYRLAKQIGVPAMRISEICAGKRSITADSALRLARALGTTPNYWLVLQATFDTEEIMRDHGEAIAHIELLAA